MTENRSLKVKSTPIDHFAAVDLNGKRRSIPKGQRVAGVISRKGMVRRERKVMGDRRITG